MKSKLFYLLIAAIALFSLYSIGSQRLNDSSNGKKPPEVSVFPADNAPISTSTIKILDLQIEIADNPIERARGLSGRESLPADSGLLFVFPKPDFHHFWMKDMKFPIDIIWLDENYQIVGLTEDFRPESYPNVTATSREPAKYVLEVNAGFAEKRELREGDRVDLTRN